MSNPPLNPTKPLLHFLARLSLEARMDSSSAAAAAGFEWATDTESPAITFRDYEDPATPLFAVKASIARLTAIVERYSYDGNGLVKRTTGGEVETKLIATVENLVEKEDKIDFIKEWRCFKGYLREIMGSQAGQRMAYLVGIYASVVGLQSGCLGQGMADPGVHGAVDEPVYRGISPMFASPDEGVQEPFIAPLPAPALAPLPSNDRAWNVEPVGAPAPEFDWNAPLEEPKPVKKTPSFDGNKPADDGVEMKAGWWKEDRDNKIIAKPDWENPLVDTDEPEKEPEIKELKLRKPEAKEPVTEPEPGSEPETEQVEAQSWESRTIWGEEVELEPKRKGFW